MKLGVGAGAVAVALVLAACSSSGGGTSNGSKIPDDGCTAVVVATSSEKVNLMEDLGRAFKQSPEHEALATCASVVPINVSSGAGAQTLAADPTSWPLKDQNYWPTVWSPASTVWTNRVVAAGGEHLVAGAESFARTPVVFAVPQTMATALGYPAKPIGLPEIEKLISDPKGWGSVGKPLWGSFKIAKTNPNTSTTGLSVILMQSYAASKKAKHLTVADVQKSAAFSRVFEGGAIHYGDTTGKVLQTLYNATQTGATGSGYVSAVAVEETSLFNYNLGNPDSHPVQPGEKLTPPKEKLVAIYPSGGSMWSDNPAVVLGSPWVTPAKQAAGQAFLKFLKTRLAQELLLKYGFRPLDTSVNVSQYLNAEVGIDPAQPTITLPEPSANVVSAAIDQWADIRKPSAILELIDISGSMEEAAGDGRSKLDGAIDGAQSTLGNFRRTDEIGLWAFTTGIKSDHGANVVPVREFAPLGGDRETMKSSVADLQYTGHGGTPLYDAVATAYDYMVQHAETGRINAIVVLSDGQDTDSDLSLDSLLIKIDSSAKEGTAAAPVRIFTIAYGNSADTESLGRISKASGGQLFDATDPTKIDAVFASVINNF